MTSPPRAWLNVRLSEFSTHDAAVHIRMVSGGNPIFSGGLAQAFGSPVNADDPPGLMDPITPGINYHVMPFEG